MDAAICIPKGGPLLIFWHFGSMAHVPDLNHCQSGCNDLELMAEFARTWIITMWLETLNCWEVIPRVH